MSLLRCSPLHKLETIGRQIKRFIDDKSEYRHWSPPIDIHETDHDFLIQTELPGMDKKDVHLEVNHGLITIYGEHHCEKVIDDGNTHHIERAFGHFMRSFTLPESVDTEHVVTKMKDGVLEVHLAKKESAKATA